MNYIEELFARQGALLRAVSRVGSRRRAEEEGAAETVRAELRTWEGWAVTGESVRELSERCERDARRYDGGFPLY